MNVFRWLVERIRGGRVESDEQDKLEQVFSDAMKYRLANRKVASNKALVRFLESEFVSPSFVPELVRMIGEDGLTFSERELITRVTDRIARAWKTEPR